VSNKAEICAWCNPEYVAAPWGIYFTPTTSTEPGLEYACEACYHDGLAYAFDETPTDLHGTVRAEWEPHPDYVTVAQRAANAAQAAHLVHQPMCDGEWCCCGKWCEDRRGWLNHSREVDLAVASTR
jgi:hypothetical protein